MMDGSGKPQRRLTSETIDVLRNRVSVRKYTSEPVTEATVEAILQAAFRAPTSSNIQSYSVVVVRDAETKKRLSAVTGGQKHVVETDVFLGFCADLTRIDHAIRAKGHSFDQNNLEFGVVSTIDAALVGMSAYLAAESLGLGGVMIGAIRNNAAETAGILGLPHHVYCVFGMCLGWPAEAPQQKPRMDYAQMVHYERYGRLRSEVAMVDGVQSYDAALAAHYTSTGKPTASDSWTHETGSKFHVQPREKLRSELKDRGFDFR
jgi:FMN reductase (NADPH)